MARGRVRVLIRRWFDINPGQAIGLRGLVAATRSEPAAVETAIAELLAAGELERTATGGYGIRHEGRVRARD